MTDAVYRSAEAAASIEAHYRQVLENWPVAKNEIHVPTREGSTFVIVCGPEHAPPVVLFHGSQANSAAWLPDVALWSETFRLYAVDMIGEPGLSARVRPRLDGDAHALWLDDVFAGLGLKHAAIVGTSLGGWLALDYASKRPAFADALALIVPGGVGRQKNFLLKALPLTLLGPWGQRKIREMVFGPAPEKIPAPLQAIAALMNAIGNAVKPRVVTMPRLGDVQLQALDMPLLAILGGRDVLLDSAATRERLRQNVTQAEIRFIDQGYHFLPGQAAHIMEFLERSLPAAGR